MTKVKEVLWKKKCKTGSLFSISSVNWMKTETHISAFVKSHFPHFDRRIKNIERVTLRKSACTKKKNRWKIKFQFVIHKITSKFGLSFDLIESEFIFPRHRITYQKTKRTKWEDEGNKKIFRNRWPEKVFIECLAKKKMQKKVYQTFLRVAKFK